MIPAIAAVATVSILEPMAKSVTKARNAAEKSESLNLV
jgi:hypothetical protein